MEHNVWIPLLLAVGAGLSTGIGSLLGIFTKKPSDRYMAFTLGFSAGVMILVSFVELLSHAISVEGVGFFKAHVAFFLGMGVYFLIDVLIPHDYIGQHDHVHDQDDDDLKKKQKSSNPLNRTGILVALGIGIHNFPEGMVTYVGGVQDLHLGAAIATAIAIHNIPEGLAIAAPLYAATGSRKKAFLWSFLSGIAEIIGAVLAAVILGPYLSEVVVGYMFAVVAGIMIVLSLDELIPASKQFKSDHTPILGVIVGMIVMMLSLWMLQ